MIGLTTRPESWDEFAGNDKAVKYVRFLCDMHKKSEQGLALWITGDSGTGKSTMAGLVAKELGASDLATETYNGKKVNLGAVDRIEREMQYRALDGGWRAIIIDEAHSMSDGAVQSWLSILEANDGNLPDKFVVIFTTTEQAEKDLFDQYTRPLLSRVKLVAMSNYGVKEAFTDRLEQVAKMNGWNIDRKKLARLIQDCNGNLRLALNQLPKLAFDNEGKESDAA